MLVFNYESKKALKESIGKPLRYIETSMFGEEYKPNGVLTGANRPHITHKGLTYDEAEALIRLGRQLHERIVEENKQFLRDHFEIIHIKG